MIITHHGDCLTVLGRLGHMIPDNDVIPKEPGHNLGYFVAVQAGPSTLSLERSQRL